MSLFKSLDSIHDIESAPIGVNFSIVEFKPDSFLNKILDGTLSNIKIENDIILGYKNYFNYDNFMDPKLRPVFQSLWSNLQFLNCIFKVLSENEKILSDVRLHYITSINTIAYDYYASNLNNEKDSEVLNLLLKIASLVDLNYILPLTAIIDKSTASFIAMANYSSFDKKECIRRLNEFITCIGYDFSIKDIIYIYSIYYSDNFSDLFITSMMDTERKLLNPEEHKMYDNISLSLLYILNSMESDEIYKVLRRYAEYLMLMNIGTSLRFSLNGLSEDFARISNVVEVIKTRDNLNIP